MLAGSVELVLRTGVETYGDAIDFEIVGLAGLSDVSTRTDTLDAMGGKDFLGVRDALRPQVDGVVVGQCEEVGMDGVDTRHAALGRVMMGPCLVIGVPAPSRTVSKSKTRKSKRAR